MQNKLKRRTVEKLGRAASGCVVVLGLGLTLCTTGCLSPLNKHAVALSAATAPVVDGAAVAYNSAESIHDLRENYEAAQQFDAASPVYNPRKIQPLLNDHDIEIRLSVLAAFQAYSRSLVEVTNNTDSPELDAASRSAGEGLSALGNSLAPSIENTLGIASTTATQTIVTTTTPGTTSTTSSLSTTPTPAISPAVRTGIETAVNALGQYLVSKKIKSQLPAIVKTMDPNVTALCQLLEQDLDTLQSQEQLDFNYIINTQTLFLRSAGMDAQHPAIDPGVRREQIMQLPEIVRQQRSADMQLTALKASVVKLAMTHHALAAAAQDNNPESLKDKLSELEAAGSNLGKF
ncbi:hypothetical protein [Granulicella tundricola]|uniref:Uncharacterized protein n=1 Tax=Granulicella tundricola (strain ATCC BAA-1859 / DSM 23138 / MP5ACTX9) TaxID=1198114 RepID=E8X453_GRATM|nr:hypothetical protein [Granulicella tundricola]ADW67113.1 hypothetical protein AciX9_0022 [Granulicella tundricola MP5ACTX9]